MASIGYHDGMRTAPIGRFFKNCTKIVSNADSGTVEESCRKEPISVRSVMMINCDHEAEKLHLLVLLPLFFSPWERSTGINLMENWKSCSFISFFFFFFKLGLNFEIEFFNGKLTPFLHVDVFCEHRVPSATGAARLQTAEVPVITTSQGHETMRVAPSASFK